MCCSKFQRCQFLLEEITESAEEAAICGTSCTSFVPHMDRGVETYLRIMKVSWKVSASQNREPLFANWKFLIYVMKTYYWPLCCSSSCAEFVLVPLESSQCGLGRQQPHCILVVVGFLPFSPARMCWFQHNCTFLLHWWPSVSRHSSLCWQSSFNVLIEVMKVICCHL